MFKIHIRNLIQYPPEVLREVLTGRFIIIFDNGNEMETNAAMTVYSSYAWQLILQYSEVEVTELHHVQYYLLNKKFEASTTIKLYSAIYRSIIEAYQDKDGFDVDVVMKLIYQINNKLYNEISKETTRWCISLDILDFKDVLDNEAIREVKNNLVITPNGINKAQQDIMHVLMTEPSLDNNIIARCIRAGILAKGQVAKCIGPCGYFTDIDSYIFPRPVLRGYAEGLRSFHDSMVESRSGAKSLEYANTLLSQTQYFARKCQLTTMNLQKVHKGDCGSKKYIDWYVRPKEVDEEDDRLLYQGDFKNIVGKRYFNEELQKEVSIKENDTHLIGKTIKLRTLLHCQHEDPYGVCEACFGDMYLSIPKTANLGHLASLTLGEPITSAALSVKHLDGTAIVEKATVLDIDKQFIRVTDNGEGYKLEGSCRNLLPTLLIEQKDASMISHIFDVDNVDQLHAKRVSSIDNIIIEHYLTPPKTEEDRELGAKEERSIKVSIQRRKGFFTLDFLDYVKKVGLKYIGNKYISIDLSTWDYRKTFISLPMMHHSMGDHAKAIEQLIENRGSANNSLYRPPLQVLTDLFDLVNSAASVNVSVNIVFLECIVLAMKVKEDDMSCIISKDDNAVVCGVDTLTNRRSFSAILAYQNHRSILADVTNFITKDRPNYPLDALIVPELMNQ